MTRFLVIITVVLGNAVECHGEHCVVPPCDHACRGDRQPSVPVIQGTFLQARWPENKFLSMVSIY
jgi:hypothetical protein